MISWALFTFQFHQTNPDESKSVVHGYTCVEDIIIEQKNLHKSELQKKIFFSRWQLEENEMKHK